MARVANRFDAPAGPPENARVTPSRSEPSSRTAAVVLAAGLGTRMRSRTPKILHPLCGRPMLALRPRRVGGGGGRARRVGRELGAAGRRLLARDRSDPRGRRRAWPHRAPGRAARHRRRRSRGAGRPARTASRRSSCCRVTCRSCSATSSWRSSSSAGWTTPRSRSRPCSPRDPGELGRVVRSEFGSVERIVEARDATRRRARGERGQRRRVRLRRGLAPAPDRRPHPVAVERRAVPDRARPARPRGRPDRERGGLRRRRHARRDQRPQPARPGRVGAPGPDQRVAHARRRDDARPVDRLRRLGRHARDGRPPRPRRPAQGRDPIGEGSRIGPDTTIIDSTIGRECEVRRSVVERLDRGGRRDGRAVRAPAPRQPHRRRLRDRQLRRGEELAPRARA